MFICAYIHDTPSFTRVPDMYATWLYHMYSRVAYNNSRFSYLDPRAWTMWPYCNWSECAVDPSVVTGVQQRLGHCR